MNRYKNLRFAFGHIGFLSIGLYLILALFGKFSVAEPEVISEYAGFCGGLVYVVCLILAFFNNVNLISHPSSDEKIFSAFGIVFYLLFLTVEVLTFGSPARGVIHAILPLLALPIPAVVSFITYSR